MKTLKKEIKIKAKKKVEARSWKLEVEGWEIGKEKMKK
jgi:hypothetical protein